MSRGVEYSSELLAQRRRYFHKAQLRPFTAVLFGKYLDYYKELESESEKTVSDDDYLLIGDTKSGAIIMQSPRSVEDLSELSDIALLDYINQWKEEHDYESGTQWGWMAD